MGLIPPIPDEVHEAASRSRLEFGQALMKYVQANPKAAGMMPLSWQDSDECCSVNLASLWGILQTMPRRTGKMRRVGFTPGPTMGEEIFQAILDHPEGLWIGRVDPDKNMEALKTEDGKIHVYIPEMKDWLLSITTENEKKALEPNPDYPLILQAGRHMDMNANTLMRNPEWNRGRRACTLAMNPQDAEDLGLTDGQMVRVITEAGSEEIELEVTDATRKGQVIMPHGFGLVYKGKKYGANANRLTKNTNRDRFAATPLHRYVPCRVEAL